MNYKPFIKLGNKSFNLQMISYINLNDDDLTVTIEINFDIKKFKFNNEENYNRFKSYIRLFSTDFGENEILIEQENEANRSLLKD
jgi:hypothetical protein